MPQHSVPLLTTPPAERQLKDPKTGLCDATQQFDLLLFMHLRHRIPKHQGHGCLALGFSPEVSGTSGEQAGGAASALPPAANNKSGSCFSLKAEGFIYF